jgi:hypothetical protein
MNSFNKMHVCGLVIVLSLAMLACGTVQAGVVSVTPASSTNEMEFDSQISATDLINLGQPSFLSSDNTVAPVSVFPFTIAGTNDGTAASYTVSPDESFAHNTWYLWSDASTTLTYTLNTNPLTGGSAKGYDINNVKVFTGWQDAYLFTNQIWTMRVSTLTNPAFTDVQSVDFTSPATAKASMISLTDSTGTIASGVTSVQFYVQKKVTVPDDGNLGIVLREIDVVGTATVPEPSTIALLGIAALAGLVAVRRSRG